MAEDSVLIASDDPVALVQTARHLMDDVYGAPGQLRLRIALHHGEVQTREREADLRPAIVGASAILRPAVWNRPSENSPCSALVESSEHQQCMRSGRPILACRFPMNSGPCLRCWRRWAIGASCPRRLTTRLARRGWRDGLRLTRTSSMA